MKKGHTLLYWISMFLFLFGVLLLTSCADSVQLSLPGEPSGFWAGLWHGLILPISFIGSLFSDNIAIYAINNSGGWYDFGFYWGTAMTIGGGSSSLTKRR